MIEHDFITTQSLLLYQKYSVLMWSFHSAFNFVLSFSLSPEGCICAQIHSTKWWNDSYFEKSSEVPNLGSNEQLLSLALNGSGWRRKHSQKPNRPSTWSECYTLDWKLTVASSTLMLSYWLCCTGFLHKDKAFKVKRGHRLWVWMSTQWTHASECPLYFSGDITVNINIVTLFV